MTKEYWLKKEKKKFYDTERLLWKLLVSSSLIEFNLVSW
jgi:hypothetical protein